MTTSERNTFWSKLSLDKRRECLLSALSSDDDPGDIKAYVDSQDISFLLTDIAEGVDRWIVGHFSTIDLGTVCAPQAGG